MHDEIVSSCTVGFELQEKVMLKSMVRTLLIIVALSGLTIASAYAAPAKWEHTAKGNILVDDHGMTLYTYAKDKHDQSVCYGKCAKSWPPLKASTDAKAEGDWSVVGRADGIKQWAYKGKPLYTFVKDKKPGEMNGEGFKNVWYIVKN